MDPILHADRAHSARMYDYWLGGKDNFALDRALGDKITAAVPAVPYMARANRAFMLRATRFLVREAGIRQFLDVGTGIPTRPNPHEVAQEIVPETRVVYVDNDPMVLAHSRALLTSTAEGRCAFLDADLRDPEAIVSSRTLTEILDLTQPVAVTLGSLLMLLDEHDDPWARVATLMDAVPRGSYLVVSHPTADLNPAAMGEIVAATNSAGFTFVPRPRADVLRFFTGLDMVKPGLVSVLAWRPDEPPTEDTEAALYWAGVARK